MRSQLLPFYTCRDPPKKSGLNVIDRAFKDSSPNEFRAYYKARERLAACNGLIDMLISVRDNIRGLSELNLYIRDSDDNFELLESLSDSRGLFIKPNFDFLIQLDSNYRSFMWDTPRGLYFTFVSQLTDEHDYVYEIPMEVIDYLFLGFKIPQAGVLIPINIDKTLRGFLSAFGESLEIGDANFYYNILYFASLSRDLSKAVDMLDPLTVLKPRKFLEREFKYLVESCIQEESPLSVIMFDIDHFKSVNDTYGHLSGDLVLSTIARSVRQVLRKSEKANLYHLEAADAYRYGGEEFVVFVKGGQQAATAVATRIYRKISELQFTFASNGTNHIYSPTVSMGIRSLSPSKLPNIHLQNIIGDADLALYRAKSLGRKRIVLYESPDQFSVIYNGEDCSSSL